MGSPLRCGWKIRNSTSTDTSNHIAVPAPGGDHELAALASEIGSIPLDWHRPLWDLWFIEGLADGKVAIMMRMHHCAIDGMGGVEMIFQMFTMAADQTPGVAPTDEWTPEPIPSQALMMARSVPSLVLNPIRGTKAVTDFGIATARKLVGSILGRGGEKNLERVGAARVFSGSRLPFNEIITRIPHKSTSFASISMADIKRIREIHGRTVNDVVLAACTAAIRRWLIDHNALPEGPVIAGNPVNTRSVDEKGAFENKFNLFALQLPTHLADPVERLNAVNAAASSAKEATRRSGTNVLDNVFQVLAPGVAEVLLGGVTVGLGKWTPPPFNTLITNVQGPPIPLYLAGAKLERMYIQMMQIAGLSLIFAVMSYAGELFVCVTGHRENTPDMWTFPEEITKEVARLLAAKPATPPATR